MSVSYNERLEIMQGQIDDLNKVVAELAVRIGQNIREFEKFVELDKDWSDDVNKAINRHVDGMMKLADANNVSNIAMVAVMRHIGLSDGEAAGIVSVAHEMNTELKREACDSDEVSHEMIAKIMEGIFNER